jgi:hypothetical protein
MVHDDLFPRDFIYSLSPPSNYIGNSAFFGFDAPFEENISSIEDAEDVIPLKHKKEFELESLPDSLYDALGYFLIINAIMNMRKPITKHRSMLINVSRFTNIHEQVRDQVQLWLDQIRIDIQNYSSFSMERACQIPSINRLCKLWDKFGFESKVDMKWEIIQQNYLHKAVSPMKIIVVNQRTEKTGPNSLDYSLFGQNGLRVITIGGNSLSRGLTLEGLCTSYFYRNSQAYDTLLQMGRWFGYRPNYEDLVHIWMSGEARECYTHITLATMELRDEIEYMNQYGLTPRDYGLMVRAHPDSIDAMVGRLLVTARNKMKATSEFVHTVSVSGKLIETPRFLNNENMIRHNYLSIQKFVEDLNKYQSVTDNSVYHGNHRLWINIPGIEVAALVRDFLTDPMYMKFQAESLGVYIEQMEHLQYWDVAIPEGDHGSESSVVRICDQVSIVPEERSVDSGENGKKIRINGDRSRVGSRPCTRYGLIKSEIQKCETPFMEQKKQPSDSAFLTDTRKPLLLLHFVDMKPKEHDDSIASAKESFADKNIYLTAIGLGFPRVLNKNGDAKLGCIEDGNAKVRYIINKVKQQQLMEAFTEVDDADD